LVLGHSGQDGVILREQLDARGRSWAGVGSTEAAASDGVDIAWYDLSDRAAVEAAMLELRPREVYYLAAQHSGSSAKDEDDLGARYVREIEVNSLGVLRHLEAIRKLSPDTRFLFASSSLVFAPTASPEDLITEQSPYAPSEPYGAEKLLAGLACRDYRRHHGLFTSVVFLFNHESVHRREGYFSSQVVKGIRRIQTGETNRFEVGNLEAIVDWSYAGDVTDAMQRALAHESPQDYVVASGVGRTIREFLQVAFDHVGLDLDAHIEVNRDLLRRTNSCRVGDAGRLREATGWEPRVDFADMVRMLLDEQR